MLGFSKPIFAQTVLVSSGNAYGGPVYAYCPAGYTVTGCSQSIVEYDGKDTSTVVPLSDMRGCYASTRSQNLIQVYAICAKTCN